MGTWIWGGGQAQFEEGPGTVCVSPYGTFQEITVSRPHYSAQ